MKQPPQSPSAVDSAYPEVPSLYHRIAIKYSKFGVEDFDFSLVSSLNARAETNVYALHLDITTKPSSAALRQTYPTHTRIPSFKYFTPASLYVVWPSRTLRPRVELNIACSANSGLSPVCSRMHEESIFRHGISALQWRARQLVCLVSCKHFPCVEHL